MSAGLGDKLQIELVGIGATVHAGLGNLAGFQLADQQVSQCLAGITYRVNLQAAAGISARG